MFSILKKLDTITWLTISAFFCLILAIYFFYQQDFVKKNVINEANDLEILFFAQKQLVDLWENGDFEEKFRSGKYRCSSELGMNRKLDGQYFRCNPNFLECFFKNEKWISIKYQNKRYKVKAKLKEIFSANSKAVKKHYKIVTRNNSDGVLIPDYAVEVELYLHNNQEKTLPVLLEDSCHNVYLPQMIYESGVVEDKKYKRKESSWRWDNIGLAIYVDKTLVTIRDISDWLMFGKNTPKIMLPKDRSLWAGPAFGLTLKQMKEYCAFKGKELLSARVFDAASFFMADNAQDREVVKRTPYPWGNNYLQHFLYQARENKKFIFKPEYCNQIYTKECLEIIPYNNYQQSTSSWIGINHTIGGYFEVFNNELDPARNLKASSFYFNVTSLWHQLGERAFWDGEGFDLKNFSFKSNYGNDFLEPHELSENYKVGFRCMKVLRDEN